MTLASILLSATLVLAPVGAAYAVRAADTPPPAPEAVRAANPKVVVAIAQRSGQITAIAAAADQIEIDGTWYRRVDGLTRIQRQGREVGVSVLTKGQRVSFSSAAGDGRTLGTVDVQ